MAVRPDFNIEQFRRGLEAKRAGFERAAVSGLQRIGEEFVNNARSNDTYKDQTGNLRSSIGYVILKDGAQVFGSGFEQVKKGVEGTKSGPALIEDLAIRYARGYVLIVVAGMDYALAVETKGYDVLTASSIVAERDLKTAIDTLQKKAA
jgi:hypothetical protein